jgi:cytochrome c
MSTLERRAAAFALAFALATGAHAAGPRLGQAASEIDIALVEIDVAPDGDGLPSGQGTVADGVDVYMEKCAACHGTRGEGRTAPPLAGGFGSLGTKAPLKTVGSYWPHATTLFDYVRRAMPYDRPMSLTNEEVWSLTAYVLWLNGIVGRSEVLDASTLPKVRMPNRDGFIDARTARPQ